MQEKYSSVVKITAVSYLNTYPFLLGLDKLKETFPFDLQLHAPSVCGRLLIQNKVNIGLVPTATILQMNAPYTMAKYGIASKGKVNTVLLLSNEKVKDWNRVFLDPESMTSRLLCKILLLKHWKKETMFLDFPVLESINAKKGDAYLLIGDKSLRYKSHFKHVYDLSEQWFNYCGLPFQFALWLAHKKPSEEFELQFSKALQYGTTHINKALEKYYKGNEMTKPQAMQYLNNNIIYPIDDELIKAKTLYLQLAKEVLAIDGVN